MREVETCKREKVSEWERVLPEGGKECTGRERVHKKEKQLARKEESTKQVRKWHIQERKNMHCGGGKHVRKGKNARKGMRQCNREGGKVHRR